MRGLHRYAVVLAVSTLGLIAAGGMVTSTNSGLSVPDWPTTYVYQMFSFPLSGMVGGIFYEHGHRLIASMVGLLTIGLLLFLWRVEPRRWMKRLGALALLAVVTQGVLGGITVLLLLPDAVSIGHAALAQVFFCLVVAIAVFTSNGWRTPRMPPVDDPALAARMAVLTAAVYLQILLGATIRHTGGGLAIPDFPLSYGRVIPPFWTTAIALHFAHRVGAVWIAVFTAINLLTLFGRYRARTDLVRPALLLVGLVLLQITLGAFVVLTGKQPVVNSLHVATGALVLAAALVLTLRLVRVRFAEQVPAT